jgi:1-acyl-sn-glycerol-3-phosphate acyltransferase
MTPREVARAIRNWTPFIARTVGYGTVSLAFGPLTRDRRASLAAMRAWCKSTTRGLNIEVTATGLENVPATSAFVYCSNHQSLIDILVLGSVLPGDYKWAAKRSLMRIPFLGWHLRLAGHVAIDRGRGADAAAQAIARFEEVLRRGKPLLVFPEGTRSEDGIIRSFKVGGFAAAVRAGVPIVPIALEGTHGLMRKGAFDVGHGTIRHVTVAVGAAIAARPEGSEKERIDELRERTRAAILALHRSIGGTVLDVADGGERADEPPGDPDQRRSAGA